MGEELALEDEKLNSVVQSINDLVRKGSVTESPIAILFPSLIRAFPQLFVKVNDVILAPTACQGK